MADMRKMQIKLRDDALQSGVRFDGISCRDNGDGCTADADDGLHIGFDVTVQGIVFTSITPTWVI